MVHVEFAAKQLGDVVAFFDRPRFAVRITCVVSFDAALGAGAVVAYDCKDNCVVGFAFCLDGIQQAADFVVGLLQKARINFSLMSKQLLLIGCKRVPGRQAVGPRRKLRVRGNQSRCLLPVKGLFADRIPAAIEAARDSVRPTARGT